MMKFIVLLLLIFASATTLGFVSKPSQSQQPAHQLSSTRDSNQQQQRQQWDPFRFVQQSSKFVTLPFQQGAKQRVIRPGDVIWQAESKNNDFTMAPLDDIVMGGVSSSTFDSSTGKWTGTVTDANNGGFIGIRSTPAFEYDMSTCKGLEWKVKTNADDTKRYKFVVRDSTDFNGITWTVSADVAGTNAPLLKLFPKKEGTGETKGGSTTTVRIPFDKLIPARFARTVPNQTFQKDNVAGVQVSYSKFEYDGDLNPKFAVGDVDLQILEIRAF